MSDIAEVLRVIASDGASENRGEVQLFVAAQCNKAADELDRLEEQITEFGDLGTCACGRVFPISAMAMSGFDDDWHCVNCLLVDNERLRVRLRLIEAATAGGYDAQIPLLLSHACWEAAEAAKEREDA